MKRLFVIAGSIAAAATITAGVVLGPNLVAGLQFLQQLDDFYADYESDRGPWPQVQDSCAQCHGDRGQPRHDGYPALAGQPAGYLEAQLQAFASGHRTSPQMAPLAANLSQEQITEFASYFARQKATISHKPDNNPELTEQGKAVVSRNGCVACHGPALSGNANIPRIAGQGQRYLADQLLAFKEQRRVDASGGMNAIAAQMSAEDIASVSHYLAGMEPEQP